MPNKGKEILVVAFKFPPMGEVGTRRWTKFAKYLARTGYTVHVIAADYPYRDTVNWAHDVEGNERIIIHRIPAGAPMWFLRPRKSVFDYVRWHLFRKTIGSKKYYLDAAGAWARYFIPAARNLIRTRGIKTMFVTGAPFSVLYQAAFVKIENPNVKLVLDYRDLWNSIPTYEYKTGLKKFSQKEESARMELFALAHADAVLYVSEGLRKTSASVYNEYAKKFHTLYNGYDTDDFKENIAGDMRTFAVLYPGNLSFGRKDALVLIAKALEKLDDDFFKKYFHLAIYNDQIDESYFKKFSEYEAIRRYFRFHKKVSPEKLFDVFRAYEYALSINAKIYPDALAAKALDYMGAGKKILHISPSGELSAYLTKKKQFVSDYDVDELCTVLRRMKADFQKKKSACVSYPEFSLERITKKLITFIE